MFNDIIQLTKCRTKHAVTELVYIYLWYFKSRRQYKETVLSNSFLVVSLLVVCLLVCENICRMRAKSYKVFSHLKNSNEISCSSAIL